ncbi:MAG TPA: hypothetical protein VGG95_08240 [Edaphobacter sp.]|jgi:hypothetical protein
MIRQAINCDMCGAEKLGSASHWFVADERDGELKLRAWGASKGSRKGLKHVCGQKCVQRLMDNFTASILAGMHSGKSAKETEPEKTERIVDETESFEDRPVLERMGYDRETAALIESESWAGPVRPKETTWGVSDRAKSDREGFINVTHAKTPVRSFQRSA